jgi:hypothetical protein
MIRYENNASQRKFFVHELGPSVLIRKLPFPPAQYANARLSLLILRVRCREFIYCTAQRHSLDLETTILLHMCAFLLCMC